MAEPESSEKAPNPASPAPKPEGPTTRILPWLIPTGVVVVFAAGGFLVGRAFGTRGQAGTAAGAEAAAPVETAPPLKAEAGESWYYELDPLVVNLNEPGVTRYIRIGLTLEVSSVMDEKDGRPFLDQKKPLVKHWLTMFMANQTIEDIRGEKNLTRMKTQICDTLNADLFPGAKPRIKGILYREFAIQ
jgi:flagellar protein FliL